MISELYAWPTFQDKMKKRGQFYLIAVVILVAVFLGILTTYNEISMDKKAPIYDTENELNIEKEKILDYIANNALNSAQSITILEDFSSTFIEDIGKNKNIVFIIGDNSTIKILGNIYSGELNYSTGTSSGTITEGEFSQDVTPENGEISVKLNEHDFSYSINSRQNIYYIIEHNYNEGVYLIQN